MWYFIVTYYRDILKIFFKNPTIFFKNPTYFPKIINWQISADPLKIHEYGDKMDRY